MDHQNDVVTLAAIEDEITASFGYLINSMMEALDLSLQIFKRNFSDTKRAYDFLKDPAISLRIFQTENKAALQLYLIEVYRTFFNFEASAASLVDHSRAFINKYEEKNAAFYHAYQDKVEADFLNNPLAKFVKDIRNYVVHKGYPVMDLSFPLVGNRVHEYLLNSSSLLEWDSWTSKAREYIKSQGEVVRLYSVIEEYFQLVDSFYTWMFTNLKEIHTKYFFDVNALISKRNEFLELKSRKG